MALINKQVIYETPKGTVSLYQLSGQKVGEKQYQSDNWYAAIKLPKKSKNEKAPSLQRFSTKLKDFDAAAEFAMDEFWEICQRHKRDLPITRSKFTVIAKQFSDRLQKEGRYLSDQEHGYFTELSIKKKVEHIDVFLSPFFKGMYLEDIADRDIREFKSDRVHNAGGVVTRDQVKPSTVNRSITVLRQIFAFAVDRSLIDSSKVPLIKNMPPSRNEVRRNPDFTIKEYRSLIHTARWMISQANHPRVEKQRFLLYHLILILAKTGARMTEMNNLRWSDIDTYTKKIQAIPVGGTEDDTYLKTVEFIRIKFYGKVSRSTQAAWSSPNQNVKQYLNRLKSEQQKWAIENKWKWHEDLKVITNHKGETVQSFTRGFDAILKKCDLTYAQVGTTSDGEPILKKRNLGGLRHFFALQALKSGFDVYTLAKNMRTSPDMINQYYANEIETEDIPLQVLRRRQMKHPILDKGL